MVLISVTVEEAGLLGERLVLVADRSLSTNTREHKVAHWKISISGKGIRRASVEKLASKFKEEFGDDVVINVRDDTPPESRSDRFRAAMDEVENARSECESLRDELQEWYDNLPEAFQSGDKGDQLQSAIDELEAVMDTLEDVSGQEVDFPSMY